MYICLFSNQDLLLIQVLFPHYKNNNILVLTTNYLSSVNETTDPFLRGAYVLLVMIWKTKTDVKFSSGRSILVFKCKVVTLLH